MGLIELIVLGILFLIGCLFSAFERYSLTVVYVVALVAGGWFFFDPAHDFIAANWREVLLHQAPLYIAAGLAVAVLKWFFLVLKTAGAIKDAKETFDPDSMTGHGSKGYRDGYFPENPEIVRRIKFIDHWNNTAARGYESEFHGVEIDSVLSAQWKSPEVITDLLTPKAKRHIDDISYWIFFWPFVVISTLFKDLIVKLAKHTARFFDWAFNRLSRLVISNAAKDI
jgi:hypothetical protein